MKRVSWFDDGENWVFSIVENEEVVKDGYTHKVNLELYDCKSVTDYILAYCS